MSTYKKVARDADERLLELFDVITLLERARLLQLYTLASHNVAFDLTIAQTRAELYEYAMQKYRAVLESAEIRAIRPRGHLKGLDALISWYGGEERFLAGMGLTPEQCARLGHFFLGEDDIALPGSKGAVSPVDAMAVVWYRLRNQNTLREAQIVLGYDESKLSIILKQAYFLISDFFAYLERPRWITHERRRMYQEALVQHNMPDYTVIGFIDGIRFDIARPKENQVAHYSGYTKSHNLLFLAITFPDGT